MEWVIGLVVLGIILATIEIFIPGIGAFALLSFLSFVAATIVLMITANNIAVSILSIGILILLLVAFIAFTRRAKDIFLRTEVSGQPSQSLTHLLDSEAVAYTVLRPGGTIEQNGELYDAIAQGNIIQKGDRVKIVRVNHRKLFVRSVRELEEEREG
ncbi:MAG: NfeD family protein [Culicoidibacterales bacterium]